MLTRREILDSKPRSEWERLIDEWIYDELDRRILKRKLLDGLTFERLVEEINEPNYTLELDAIKRRFYRAEERLWKYSENAQ